MELFAKPLKSWNTLKITGSKQIGMDMKRRQHTSVIALLALSIAILLISRAFAADLSTDTPGKSTPKTEADTWLPRLQYGDDSAYILFYGRINRGILVYDDGRSTEVYSLVDNSAQPSLFGIKTHDFHKDFGAIGSNIEIGWFPYSTAYVNQLTKGDVDWDTALLRRAEVHIDNATSGRFWMGQGSMASDGTAEVDLSGTGLEGEASVADFAGAQIFRLANGGGLSDVQVAETFRDIDGLGRKLRFRYDTPSYHGFSLAASIGTQIVPIVTDEVVWDVAIWYDNNHGDFKVSGAVAYSRPAVLGDHIVSGSFSTLHVPTGLSVTIASAYEVQADGDARYIYGKVGRQIDHFDFGITAFSVDAYYGKSINVKRSESVSFGVQLVQSVDYWQTDFYAGIRTYDYDETNADYKRGIAVLTGAQISF
jgi:hypothetical protein